MGNQRKKPRNMLFLLAVIPIFIIGIIVNVQHYKKEQIKKEQEKMQQMYSNQWNNYAFDFGQNEQKNAEQKAIAVEIVKFLLVLNSFTNTSNDIINRSYSGNINLLEMSAEYYYLSDYLLNELNFSYTRFISLQKEITDPKAFDTLGSMISFLEVNIYYTREKKDIMYQIYYNVSVNNYSQAMVLFDALKRNNSNCEREVDIIVKKMKERASRD